MIKFLDKLAHMSAEARYLVQTAALCYSLSHGNYQLYKPEKLKPR